MTFANPTRSAVTLEPRHVEVHDELGRAAEALSQRHRIALRGGAFNARLVRQPARDRAATMRGVQPHTKKPRGVRGASR
ncbi:MAG TPA: hypothetical protein PLE37_12180, partial [Pseudomonadota bacterium]|nr:hypothetical protein [Pseudomonadota bacterium]